MSHLREQSRRYAGQHSAAALVLCLADRRMEERLPCPIENRSALPASQGDLLRSLAGAWRQCVDLAKGISPSLAGPMVAVLLAVAPTAASAFEFKFDTSRLGHIKSAHHESRNQPSVQVTFTANDTVIANMEHAGMKPEQKGDVFVCDMTDRQLEKLRISATNGRAEIKKIEPVKRSMADILKNGIDVQLGGRQPDARLSL